MGELLGDRGQLGAVDGAPAGLVGAAVEAAGVDHPPDGVVTDTEQGGGFADSQMRHESRVYRRMCALSAEVWQTRPAMCIGIGSFRGLVHFRRVAGGGG